MALYEFYTSSFDIARTGSGAQTFTIGTVGPNENFNITAGELYFGGASHNINLEDNFLSKWILFVAIPEMRRRFMFRGRFAESKWGRVLS